MNLKQKKNSFTLLLKIIIINLPLIGLVFFKLCTESSLTYLSFGYLFSLIFGYYFLVQFILILPAIVLSYFRRASLFIAWVILSIFMYYLILDSIVYSVYKFHINFFFIELFFIDFDNFGFTPSILLMGIVAFLFTFLVEYWVFKFAKRLSNKFLLLIIPIIALYALSQTIHIFAFEGDNGEITMLTPKIPVYFPIESSKLAKKNNKLGNDLGLGNQFSDINGLNKSINYPKKKIVDLETTKIDTLPNIVFIVLESWRFDKMDSIISPNIFKLSKKSTYSPIHYSTGNSTTGGIFGIFYGLHSTYWESVKANSLAIDNPIFIDLLKEHNFQFGIFNHSNFNRFKLKTTIFNKIKTYTHFEGKFDWQKDKSMNSKMVDFLNTNNNQHPFFGFIFYTSTHHAYSFPENDTYIYSGS